MGNGDVSQPKDIIIAIEPIDETPAPHSTPTIPPASGNRETIIYNLSKAMTHSVRSLMASRQIITRTGKATVQELHTLEDVHLLSETPDNPAIQLIGDVLQEQIQQVIGDSLDELTDPETNIAGEIQEIVKAALNRMRINFGSRTNIPRIGLDHTDMMFAQELTNRIDEDLLILVKCAKTKPSYMHQLLSEAKTYENLCEQAKFSMIVRTIMNVVETYKAQHGDGDYVNRAIEAVMFRMQKRAKHTSR